MMINKPPVGYLLKKNGGLEGDRGVCYDYILSSNGVFVEAEGPLFAARVPVSYGEIRGLAPSEFALSLRYGPLPHALFDLALNLFLTDISREWYAAIIWDNGYHIVQPGQRREQGKVRYDNPEKVILDLHSHHKMAAGFSDTDNTDEQGLKLYGVVGRLDKEPELALRAGVYGHFSSIEWEDVFDGSPTSVRMVPMPDAQACEMQEFEKEFGDLSVNELALYSRTNEKAEPRSLREELGPNAYIELPAQDKDKPKTKPKPWFRWPFLRGQK